VHAGRGIPSLGSDAIELARAYARAPLILAHAAIAHLAWIWREAGLSAEQIAMVAGGQLERLLAGAESLNLGPAPGAPEPCPGPLLERTYTLLVAAAARLTAGYPAEEYLELALLAWRVPPDHPDAPVAASVRGLLDRHVRDLATDPLRRGPRVPGST